MRMMDRRILIICSLVGFLGLLSAVLGFAAEVKRIKASQVVKTGPGLCHYPTSPAYRLGVFSAFFLLLAQITINVAGGCVCCRRNSNPSAVRWTFALICFIISWFTFVIGFLVFLGAAALNNKHSVEDASMSYYSCFVLKPGVFCTASVLAIATTALGIVYYITLSSGKSANNPLGGTTGPNHSGIAMGQPQVPPTSHDPVFVHEDTYNRRQFA